MLNLRGLTVADMEHFSYGMLINYCYAHDRQIRRSRGEKISDPEEQYNKLKAIEPIVKERYKKGEITEERYKSFMRKLNAWECD